MSREPLTPHELDPTTLDPARIELIDPEAQPARPLVVSPLPPPRRRPWLKLMLGAGGLFVAGWLGLEAYDFVTGLFERSVALGSAFAALLGLAVAGGLGMVAREFRSLRRLERVDELRQEGERLLQSTVHGRAEALLARIRGRYEGRGLLAAELAQFERQAGDALNDGERLRLFADIVLAPHDRAAYQLVKLGARDIGALTALSPLGLLDSVIVLVRTVMMVRAIAMHYGMRPGTLATARLIRSALRNLVVAGVGELVSDAAVETAGASILSMLSARAGQGIANGLLAAKIGLSTMQLCRPLPFAADEMPSMKRLREEIFSPRPDPS